MSKCRARESVNLMRSRKERMTTREGIPHPVAASYVLSLKDRRVYFVVRSGLIDDVVSGQIVHSGIGPASIDPYVLFRHAARPDISADMTPHVNDHRGLMEVEIFNRPLSNSGVGHPAWLPLPPFKLRDLKHHIAPRTTPIRPGTRKTTNGMLAILQRGDTGYPKSRYSRSLANMRTRVFCSFGFRSGTTTSMRNLLNARVCFALVIDFKTSTYHLNRLSTEAKSRGLRVN